MSFNKTEEKGITLVALVITIIILLILAGVAIAQLTGNGLFEKTRLAKEKHENAQELENTILADYESKIGEVIDGTRETVTVDKQQYEQLLSDVNELKNKFYYTENITETTIVTSTLSELKSYTITQDGIYMVEFFSEWKNYSNAAGPRYNVIYQKRNSDTIETTLDGDSGYSGGTDQYTNTTTFFNCKEGDVLVFNVSQYTSENKQVLGKIKLTRL